MTATSDGPAKTSIPTSPNKVLFASATNLYVSTKGDDGMANVPVGSEGRAWNYAYKSVAAAAAKAEEVIVTSPLGIGPYRQAITYNSGASNSQVATSGVTSSKPRIAVGGEGGGFPCRGLLIISIVVGSLYGVSTLFSGGKSVHSVKVAKSGNLRRMIRMDCQSRSIVGNDVPPPCNPGSKHQSQSSLNFCIPDSSK